MFGRALNTPLCMVLLQYLLATGALMIASPFKKLVEVLSLNYSSCNLGYVIPPVKMQLIGQLQPWTVKYILKEREKIEMTLMNRVNLFIAKYGLFLVILWVV